MNTAKLERHLSDMILEAQLKMGYESNTMLFNYSFTSLKNITGCDCSIEEMNTKLEEFTDEISDRFGKIQITQSGSMFCLKVPPKGADYVHDNITPSEFLKEFIAVLGKWGTRELDIIQVFRKYSENVHVQEVDNGEFDYLIFFEDGVPDDYYYCLTDEGLCITYHRFIREDYLALGF
ncbi:MAG: DUF3877 family protein [Oscillospiraceae bacterium]|nr:DUF3877 family protein [Oscillospiraceae bacterium]